MQITNLEQTGKHLKHLAGRKPVIEAVVGKVEGKALQFTPDNIVHVEVQFDSNKNRIKAGDKVSITLETGEIALVERAPKEKATPEVTTPVVKEPATRGSSRSDVVNQR